LEINPWINDDRIITKMEKSCVLVLGARGYIGKYIAKASAQLGHPTFILVQPATLDSSKKESYSTHLQQLGSQSYMYETPGITLVFFFFKICIHQGYSYF
jgi:hypothetical protein